MGMQITQLPQTQNIPVRIESVRDVLFALFFMAERDKAP